MPFPLTDLLGRERELAAVVEILARCRFLTLTGPGGAGKTRLALAAASELFAVYEHGRWRIDLTEVGDLAELWANVAAVLGLGSDDAPLMRGRVIAHVRRRRLLLLLDNCDRVAPECAELAATIALACPGVSLLCTSRQPLGVDGERVWPLGGLAVDAPGPAGRHGSDVSPAVRLFVERAVAQRADFALGPAEGLVVAELCRRLDGLPLAIELLAGRIGVISPHEMLACLDDRFALLVGGGPALPARHRSLAAALAWSHSLLSSEEATLLRRLAVFEGGFTLAAAHVVCGSPATEDTTVLATLASLVAKSWAVAEPTSAETRYRLPENVRVYVVGRLAAAREESELQERHAQWVLRFAQEADSHLRGAGARPWLSRLAAEQDNVRAALAWAVAGERADVALALTAAMATFWRRARLLATGAEWLSRALALPDQPALLRVRALLALGSVLGESGDRSRAVGVLEEARQLAEDCGDVGAEARALTDLGYVRLFVDLPSAALATLECSTRKAQLVGDRPTLLESLSNAGWVAIFGGDAPAAEARLRECLAASEGKGDASLETWAARVGMGWAALTQGRHIDAEDTLLEALKVANRFGSKHAEAVVTCFLGQLARARGEYGRARALLGESLAHARTATNSFPVAMRLTLLGAVAQDEGDLTGAESALLEVLTAPGAAGIPYAHAHCLAALGSLRVSQGRLEEAAAHLDEATAVASRHEFCGVVAAALVDQARLRRLGDDLQGAAQAATDAIELHDRLGNMGGLIDALETLGGIRASQGQCRTAGRLFAATSTARMSGGIVRPPVRAARHELDVVLARSNLTPEEWDAVWTAGSRLSVGRAAALAVRRNGRRDCVRTGWDAITPAEREVLALVAQGLTNREAASRLMISTRTVETHVAHLLDKLGIASRRELTRVAAAKGFG